MEDQFASITEELADAYLALNQLDEAIGLLRGHVRTHPLREGAHALLMRALCRTGDGSGALAAFASARKTFVDQLGIEPGPELQGLQRAILNGERPAVAPGRRSIVAGKDAPTTRVARPRELPPDIGYFVGRSSEAARARAVLELPNRSSRRRPPVVVLHGPGGAGKSALAIHVAHRLAEQFPDGQLYINLFGATPGLRPLGTTEVLGRMLRSLGTAPSDIPHEEADAAARLRTVTADQRLLVVLDNADDAVQINAVLPATSSCGVLVTSRRPLSAIDADCRVRLAGLPPAEGVALFRRLAGRTIADEAIAGRIVELCEHLPLAVRVAAGRLTGRPDLSPSDFVDRLADGRRRLDELELDGLAVRSCIRVGYDGLVSSQRETNRLAAQAFRALGLLKVPDVNPDVVAALVGCADVALVRAVLDVLVGAELVEPMPGERYRLHDLVRLVAAEEAAATDDAESRAGILLRGLAYYAHGVVRADRMLRTARFTAFSDPPVISGVPLLDFTGPAEAMAWISVELSALVAATEQAASLSTEARRMALWFANTACHYLFVRYEWQTLRHLGGSC